MLNSYNLRQMRKNSYFDTPTTLPDSLYLRYNADLRHVWRVCVVFLVSCVLIVFWASFANAQEIDLKVIAKIESSNNPLAYNKASKASGLYQITPICLKDYNQFHKVKLSMRDMFIPNKAVLVANWYLNVRIPSLLKHFNLKDTVQARLWAYNAGIGLVKRGIMPKETRNYVLKYNKGV